MEKVVFVSENIRFYDREKPSEFRVKTYLGKILITNERFLFLSSGSNGLAEIISTKLIFGQLIGDLILGETLTKDLNLSALEKEGSINISLAKITNGLFKKKFPMVKYLALEYNDGVVTKKVCFMQDGAGFNPKNLKIIEEKLNSKQTSFI